MVHRVSKKREKEINWKNEREIEGTSGKEHDTMAIRERNINSRREEEILEKCMLNKKILNELITTVQSFYFINFWNNFKVEFSKFILMTIPIIELRPLLLRLQIDMRRWKVANLRTKSSPKIMTRIFTNFESHSINNININNIFYSLWEPYV